MQQSKTVVIVGGVAGGATAAARLRRLDEKAEIILLEKGDYISFANCGLPYYIGGEITDKEDLTLQTPKSFNARFNVDVRVNSEAIAVNPSNKTVTVKDGKTGKSYELAYDKLVLSPGAAPLKPPIVGLDSELVFTLRNIPDTYKIKEHTQMHAPKTAVIAGGGFIGVETAENLVACGISVTLIEMANQVIAPIDYDMACDVHRHMLQKGVNLMLSTTLEEISQIGNSLKVKTSTGEIEADMLILALGVRAETDFIKTSGIALNKKGGIIVNNKMQTNFEDIYAVGDAVEITDFVTKQPAMIPLAGPANKQGRIAADQICGIDSIFEGTQGSSILKVFDMTVATTGINEKTAKTLLIPYEKSFTYSASHASYYPGATNMTIKTLFEPETGRILGAQLTGFDGVDKRCDIFATAIRGGMTAFDLTKLELCYAPPYSSAKDPVNMAGFTIENLITKKAVAFHWHEVANLPRDGSVTLLDTRTLTEYANGHIDGFINIPLDSLRARLSELDSKKPVYLTCQIGLRGYVAVRILMQNGFEAYNLSGGYRLYKSILSPLPKAISATGIKETPVTKNKTPKC